MCVCARACVVPSAEEESVQREYSSSREALDRLRAQQEQERAAFEATLKALEERLQQAEVARNEDATRRRDVQEQNKSLRTTVDSLRSQVRE